MSYSSHEHSMSPVPLCHGCSASGTCRLGLSTMEVDKAGIAHFRLTCSSSNEGGRGVGHGAWAAGALDELLGQVVQAHGQMAVVGTLNVVYVHPVPLEHPLVGRSWIDRKETRKWHVAGELCLASSGAVLARATAIFVLRDAARHYTEFAQWIDRQNDQG